MVGDRHGNRVLWAALASGAPAVVVALYLLWTGDGPPKLPSTLTVAIVLCWLSFPLVARTRVVRPLQLMANLLGGVRSGDGSMRAVEVEASSALGLALREVNAIVDLIADQRRSSLEANALLRTVMDEIDVAIFAFDDHERLTLVNRAAESMLAQPIERIRGQHIDELGMRGALEGDYPRTWAQSFPGMDGQGRWELRVAHFRQDGRPYRLIVLTDLRRVLRDEERMAWKRLVPVMSHEINNSLAPISSIADSLGRLRQQGQRGDDWESYLASGLATISTRAESLQRFMAAYAQLARLPTPQLREVDLQPLLQRVCALETRVEVQQLPGESVTLAVDPDQIEQLLINLLSNAVDASLEVGGGVQISWRLRAGWVNIAIEDEGRGLANPDNLFVPFFSTKPGGSGIGLVLCREIAEAHGGRLSLANRSERCGCLAVATLPRAGGGC